MKSKTNAQMVELLRKEARTLGSQKVLAKQIGISEAFLSDIITGKAPVTAQVARYLGYTKVTVFFYEDE